MTFVGLEPELRFKPEESRADIARIREVYLPRYEGSRGAIVDAQNLGRDIVQHLVRFMEGKDEGRGFRAYFMLVDSPKHVFQHEGFWDEICTNYPDMVTLEDEENHNKMYVFAEQGVYLLAEQQLIDTVSKPDLDPAMPTGSVSKFHGECFAISYTAHRIDTTTNMGAIATAHLMQ